MIAALFTQTTDFVSLLVSEMKKPPEGGLSPKERTRKSYRSLGQLSKGCSRLNAGQPALSSNVDGME